MTTTIRLALVAWLAGCANQAPSSSEPEFEHDIATAATPWTHERFDDSEDKFTFAIFSDLNGGEREQVFEIAVAQLSFLRPELIVSLGDLTDGGTEDREKADKGMGQLRSTGQQGHCTDLLRRWQPRPHQPNHAGILG